MWILNKISYKVNRKLYKSPLLYNISRKIANTPVGGVALPNSEEALEILEATSPRPTAHLNVPERRWPSKPTVDVSIIVPCYNVESFVEECVSSIISQNTKRSFEVICIDDGSTDSTGEKLDQLAESDARIHVVHQENKGLSGSRNAGIAEAAGNTFMFVDSDDVLLPNAIEVLYDVYESNDCDFVTASYEIISEDGKTIHAVKGKRTHGAPWGRLYSRGIWRKLEFPENLWFEDTVQGFCIDDEWDNCYIDVPVLLYRQNRKGISKTSGKSKKSLDTIWIVDILLQWRSQLSMKFNQAMYDRLIMQFGVLMRQRTAALSLREKRAMFIYACDILENCDSNRKFKCSKKGRWKDLEQALRNRNYLLWRTAVMGIDVK